MILDAATLDDAPFSAEQCATMFDAVLVNDRVDAHTEFPAKVRRDYEQRELIDFFRLARQLWKTGVDRDMLIELTRRLARDRDLGEADRKRFKEARAKFKQLRFAYILYDADHRYPIVLDQLTIVMGHLQDAYKSGRRRAAARHAWLFRLLLTPLPQALLRRETDRLKPASGPAFRRYVDGQIAELDALLALDDVTGAQFHTARKIVSRQTSLYCALETLVPSDETHRMFRALSAINGLMGRAHDDLMELRAHSSEGYHRARTPFPPEIHQRLSALTALFRSAPAPTDA